MSHPLLDSLLEEKDAALVDAAGTFAVKLPAGGRLGVLFFTGDPARHAETADVAVVLRELMRSHPGRLCVGIVDRQSQSEVMKAEGVFALPALAFYAGGERLETIPKIEDWSVYAETVARLEEEARHATAMEA